MSIGININVDFSRLLDRVRLLQSAGREAQAEKETKNRLEQKAKENRETDRKKKEADSKKKFGSQSGRQGVDIDPAAHRGGGVGFRLGHMWLCWPLVQDVGLATGLLVQTGGFVVRATGYTGVDRDYLVGCGNGNNWEKFKGVSTLMPFASPPGTLADVPLRPGKIVKTMGSGGSSSWSNHCLVLPTGSGNFIFVAINAYVQNGRQLTGFVERTTNDTPYEVIQCSGNENFVGVEYRTEGEVTYDSFIVSNESIRKINTPQTLKDILYIVGPTIKTNTTNALVWQPSVYATATTKSIQYGTGGFNSLFFSDSSNFFGTARLKTYGGFSDRCSITEVSPIVYRRLNDAKFYTNDSQLFPPAKYKGILSDGRTGIYKRCKDDPGDDGQSIYNPTDSFNYVQWYNANETPSLNVWDTGYTGPLPSNAPKYELRLSETRQTAPFGYTISTPAQVELEEVFAVIDWGDPAYCKARALELGFSQADLIP